MKYFFPAQGQSYTYLQTNRSDSLGSLWASMGLDFQSDLNTMRVAPRLMVSTNLGTVHTDVFTANGTWTKPDRIVGDIVVTAIGGGGGGGEGGDNYPGGGGGSTAFGTYTPPTISADYIVVAGGGSGGLGGNAYGGGGGGSGGVKTGTLSISPQVYTVVVGDGGSGGNGEDSIFDSVTAHGGGAGGTNAAGNSNGTGGGGSNSTNAGGTGTGGEGNNGGSADSRAAGGGGGASAVGANAVDGISGGAGGAGISSSISGVAVVYGGGGGGGTSTSIGGTAGDGGNGGGGGGGDFAGTHGSGSNGISGTIHRGGGGGGAGTNNVHFSGTAGAGGSGIVIISMPTGMVTATGGTKTTVAGKDIWTFLADDTWVVTAIGTMPSAVIAPGGGGGDGSGAAGNGGGGGTALGAGAGGTYAGMGASGAGGGGGGSQVVSSIDSTTLGATVPIIIGQGGTGGATGGSGGFGGTGFFAGGTGTVYNAGGGGGGGSISAGSQTAGGLGIAIGDTTTPGVNGQTSSTTGHTGGASGSGAAGGVTASPGSNYGGGGGGAAAANVQGGAGAPGYVSVTYLIGDPVSVANIGLPIAFEYFDFTMWTVAGSLIFKNTSAPNTPFAEDTSVDAATNYSASSDLEVFNSLLWSTTSDTLYSKVANGDGSGDWTLKDSLSLSDHPLAFFPLFDRLYYQKSNGLVTSIDTGDVIASSSYVIDFGASNPINCMVTNSTAIWMGLSANTGAKGSVASIARWDGISAVASNLYPLKARYIQAMCVYEDVPYSMDSNGILSKYNGYSFHETGRLPYFPFNPISNYIHRNGMIATKNGTILVLVKNINSVDGSVNENIPSGVWEWSEEFGFTHKYAISYTQNGSTEITDYGQNKIVAPGALYDVSEIGNPIVGDNASILAGAEYYTDATAVQYGILFDDRNDTIQKKGYFITTWFFSNEIQSKWDRIWAVFKRFLGETDSIIFKYRLYEEDPTYATITWTSTTTFTTTTDVTAYSPDATGFNGTVGGEIEVLQGTGGASCAHITNVTESMGTYTVTLDNAIVGVSTGTAKIRLQKWIKMFPEITGQINSWKQLVINDSNTRVQIKGCLTFTSDDEFVRFAMYANPDITVTT